MSKFFANNPSVQNTPLNIYFTLKRKHQKIFQSQQFPVLKTNQSQNSIIKPPKSGHGAFYGPLGRS